MVIQYVMVQKKVIKIVCIGNSIMYGVGMCNFVKDSYFVVLGQMLGDGYEVWNFGVSVCIMLMKGDYFYMKEECYWQVLVYNFDIVIIKFGINDMKLQNWWYKLDFKKDMEMMIWMICVLFLKFEIYLCYFIFVYVVQWGINDSMIVYGVMLVIDQLVVKY